MTHNFTNPEIGYIAANIGPDMITRVNKAGNIEVRSDIDPKVYFNIYRQDRGIVIRRRLENPLGRHYNQNGHYLNGNKPFSTLKDAVKYFKNYVRKNPQNVF